MMAFVHVTGVPARYASLPMQLASVAIQLLTSVYIWWRVSERSGPQWGIAGAATYLASSCAVCWAISGWETSAVALGWALAIDPVLDNKRQGTGALRSLIAAGLTVLFRPDAALLFGALAVYWGLTADSRRRWKVPMLGVLAAPPAVALAFSQWAYYGSWVPNTAILKRSAGFLSLRPGIEYVLVSLFRYPLNGAALLGAIYGARSLRRPAAVLLVSLVSVYFIYVVSVGGDHFGHARFIVPLLPTAIVLAICGLSNIQLPSVTRRKFLIRTAAVIMIGLVAFDFADEVLVDVPAQKSLNRLALITALALGNLVPKRTPIVGIFLAGTIPYFNPSIRFHDMLGKNDPFIAQTRPHSGDPGHNRWDYDYSLDKVQPDLIITSYPILRQSLSRHQTGFRQVEDFYQDLYDQAQFAALYLDNQVPIRLGGEEVFTYEAYARRGGAFDPPIRELGRDKRN